MALVWNIKSCDRNFVTRPATEAERKEQNLADGERMLTENTHALIWTTMLVDMSELTADNAKEWHWRLAFLKEIGVTIPWDSVPSTDMLRDHAGLRTNAVKHTRSQFMRRTMDIVADKVTRRIASGY
jgi:hypothetical protein